MSMFWTSWFPNELTSALQKKAITIKLLRIITFKNNFKDAKFHLFGIIFFSNETLHSLSNLINTSPVISTFFLLTIYMDVFGN